MEAPANGISRSYNTSTVSAIRFDENLFTCQYEKEKKAEGFKQFDINWLFSNYIMAVKGLMNCLVICGSGVLESILSKN